MKDIKINNSENNLSKEEIKRLERQEEFIKKSKEKFGEQFDYSKVYYKDRKTPVILIDFFNKREFEIAPYKHLSNVDGGYESSLKTSEEISILRDKKCMSEEKIIEKCKQKFTNPKYNFDNLHYVEGTNKEIVNFYCEEHGIVEERKSKLFNSTTHVPCPICRKEQNPNKLKAREYEINFFKTVKEKFGDNLDFSNSVYNGKLKPIKFICKIHGEQQSLPVSILKSPCGCPKCSVELRGENQALTTEEFVRRALEIPGNAEKYDYSETEYINNKTKVKIFCKNCQEYFWILPGNHIRLNQGHNKCCGYYKRTPEEFKEELENLCGDKIDFSLACFKTRHDSVEAICKENGYHFWRSPDSFLRGHTTCPYCTGNYVKTTEEYQAFLKDYFGDAYDFSEVEYVNRLTPVKIICPEHGPFYRTPASILDVIREGKEILCPHCNESEGERKVFRFIEENKFEYKTQYKVSECKYEKELPFDFYLPNHNLCIEYQGEQHYRPIKTWGGEEYFEKTLKRDQIKKDYCKNNKISLLEIKHDIPLDQVNDRLQNIFDKIDFKNNPCHILITKDEEIVEPY